jgi:TPR repeat protein
MSGKKARRRIDRARRAAAAEEEVMSAIERESAAAQPPPAVPSTAHEPPTSQSSTQQDASSEAAQAAPTLTEAQMAVHFNMVKAIERELAVAPPADASTGADSAAPTHSIGGLTFTKAQWAETTRVIDAANRAAAALAQPPPAAPSTAHEPPTLQARTQQDASSEASSAAPAHASAGVTGAQLAEYMKLLHFVTGILNGIERKNDSWVASEFAGDVAALAAAAQRGDVKAQLVMFMKSRGRDDEQNFKWSGRALAQDCLEMYLFIAVSGTRAYLGALCMSDGLRSTVAKDRAMIPLRATAERYNSAAAQHVLGMLMYCSQCDIGTKVDFLDAARWTRKAAMQGFAEAQYELGEMFRRGLFCKVHMRFARNYTRRASVQGHVEATARMIELRSCVMCGADDAPLACSRCRQARYCDFACSKKHWCEGGGAGGGVSGGAAARHKDTCPRTHTRRS